MSNNTKEQERRRSPRIASQHKMVVRPGSSDSDETSLDAQSINLNLGGIYCTVNRHVEMFSKMAIDIELVLLDEEGEDVPVQVPLSGVVVRVEPEEFEEGRNQYDVAMAFVDLVPESELLLAKYMLQSMANILE